jgi:uncharacterized protein
MTRDALSSDRLITTVLLKDNWETNYEAQPAIHNVATLGYIIADQELPDGRYNLLLQGMAAVRIMQELPLLKRYREARVEILRDSIPEPTSVLMQTRQELEEVVMAKLVPQEMHQQYQNLFRSEQTLAEVCNILAFSFPLPLPVKQLLLETTATLPRARILIDQLHILAERQAAKRGGGYYPPSFSAN